MSLTWHNCCKGRASSCPQIALDGKKVRIKDDYGNEASLPQDDGALKLSLDDEVSGNEITIYGEGKKPVKMSMEQYYSLLETLDGLVEEEKVKKEKKEKGKQKEVE